MHDAVDVREAAAQLDMTPSSVHRLVSSGYLEAASFAGRLVFSPKDVRRLQMSPRPSGRPFSPTASWSLLWMLAHLEPPELSLSRRAQLRRHLRDDDVEDLAGRMRHRARRQLWHVHPSMLDEVLDHPQLTPSGVSALERINGELVAGRDGFAEAYTHTDGLGVLREAGGERSPLRGNLVVHVVDGPEWLTKRVEVAIPPVVALDLIESGDARATDVGWQVWRQQLSEVEGRQRV